MLQPAQVLTKFTQAKQHRMSWSEHLMYLIALNKTTGGGYDKLILQNVVEYASSSLRTSLRARYDHTRSDYLTHAEELVEYATLIDQVDRRNNHEGDIRSHTVNLVNPERREFTSRRSKECWNCGRTGHLSRECTRERPNDESEGRRAAFNFAMSVGQAKEVTSNGEYIEWVLDNGSSLHYTKHLWVLMDLREEFHVGQTANDSQRPH
jgi:hypothetical protein